MNKTYSMKAGEINKAWLLVDAKDIVLGRLATEIAKILRVKHNPAFTPHMDCGDNIIVINAKHISLTGNKAARKDGKIYYWHTGHPGGIKQTTAGKMLEGKYPERVLELAVKRMIKNNPLRNKQMRHLHIYADAEHPHKAQEPTIYDFASKNPKNKR